MLSINCSTLSVFAQPVWIAFETLARVLRNSLACIAVGWLFGYCFTVGNVFTGLPPAQQSYAHFSAANIALFYGIFSTCVIILMATKLLSERFVGCVTNQVSTAGSTSEATRRLTLLQCTAKLLVPMTPYLVFSSTVVVGGDFAMYSTVPESWHQFKPCVYIAAFWGFFIMVMADVYVRHIFQTETVRGLKNARPAVEMNASRSNSRGRYQHVVGQRVCRIWAPSIRRFLKIYARNLPVMFFVLIAIVYVHAISQFVSLQGQWEVLAFASASISLKLMLQELAKYLMLATRRPVSRRAMVVLVSTPTILVDTQVRMLLLRQANTNVSVVGTVLLAMFEIAVRAVKSLIVGRQTRGPPIPKEMLRRWSSFASSSPVETSTVHPKSLQVMPAPRTSLTKLVRTGTAVGSRVYSKGETAAQYKARREIEERRRKRRVLHAAEIYSDMYAEYIAIGCSYAILFFYQHHAHFQFSSFVSESPSTSDSVNATAVSQESQLAYLGALQMGVEVLVDFFACALEAAEGVEFKSFDQNDPFLVFFLAILSFSNVAISAGLYMR